MMNNKEFGPARKFGPSEKKLLENITMAKDSARNLVALLNNNPLFSEEKKEEAIRKTREDIKKGAKENFSEEEKIKEILRAFDVEMDLIKQGLEENDENGQDGIAA